MAEENEITNNQPILGQFSSYVSKRVFVLGAATRAPSSTPWRRANRPAPTTRRCCLRRRSRDPVSDIDGDPTYQLQAVVTDPDKTNPHLLSVHSFEVWGPLDLDVSFAWDRIEKPTRDANGEPPESNDFRLTVGVGLEF